MAKFGNDNCWWAVAAVATLSTMALFSSPVVAQVATPTEQSAYERTLEEHGLGTEPADLREYLHDLHPTPDAIARIDGLIRQLVHDDFFKREEAMQKLLALPAVPQERLRKAAEEDDAELRWRAKDLLKQRDQRAGLVLAAVFVVIAEREYTGLAEHVLNALPLCSEPYLQFAAQRALQSTVTDDDVDALRKAMYHEHLPTRLAACAQLARMLGKESIAELEPLLEDSAESMRLQTALSLINHGNRKALEVLGELLASEAVEVRARSASILKAVTEQDFEFVAYDDAEKRARAAAAWQTWIAEEGPTASLTFPVDDSRLIFGRTLICHRSQSQLLEIDANGQPIWVVSVRNPYGCDALRNGHRLVASYSGRYVAEFNASGEEIWRADNLPPSPYSVQRLENGHLLVACYTSRKVIEIRRDKTIAWEVTLPDKPKDAQRLANGNTLVCLYTTQRIVEIDPNGEVVWELPNAGNSYAAERLPNGNTLVCQYSQGRVAEFDRQGREVWAATGSGRVYDAQRLPNGNTLFVDSTGVHEVDSNGKVIWNHQSPGARRAVRY